MTARLNCPGVDCQCRSRHCRRGPKKIPLDNCTGSPPAGFGRAEGTEYVCAEKGGRLDMINGHGWLSFKLRVALYDARKILGAAVDGERSTPPSPQPLPGRVDVLPSVRVIRASGVTAAAGRSTLRSTPPAPLLELQWRPGGVQHQAHIPVFAENSARTLLSNLPKARCCICARRHPGWTVGARMDAPVRTRRVTSRLWHARRRIKRPPRAADQRRACADQHAEIDSDLLRWPRLSRRCIRRSDADAVALPVQCAAGRRWWIIVRSAP